MLRLFLFSLFLAVVAACHRPKAINPNGVPSSEGTELETAARRIWVGKPAPTFSAALVDGKTVDLPYKGEVTLLSFWFAACPPCITEIPSLNKLQTDFAPKGLRLVALTTDAAATLPAFQQKHNCLYALSGDHKTTASLYRVSAYPTNVLIDRKGIIRQIWIGGNDWDATQAYMEISPMLTKLLSE